VPDSDHGAGEIPMSSQSSLSGFWQIVVIGLGAVLGGALGFGLGLSCAIVLHEWQVFPFSGPKTPAYETKFWIIAALGAITGAIGGAMVIRLCRGVLRGAFVGAGIGVVAVLILFLFAAASEGPGGFGSGLLLVFGPMLFAPVGAAIGIIVVRMRKNRGQ
jgi:hypothetical protein